MKNPRQQHNKLSLYIDYDCVEEFNDRDKAEKAYNEAVKEHPDSVIDILVENGKDTISLMGIN